MKANPKPRSSGLDHEVLSAVVEVQRAFIEESELGIAFSRMLDCVIELTGSEYGFLGEVLYDPMNQPYMLAHALTDISWDAESKALYDRQMIKGFEFHNLNSLFGCTLTTEEMVISNDPENDPRSGGLPHGHPGMKSYMGLPIRRRKDLLGMLGLANRKGGYDKNVAASLEPILLTAGTMIGSMRSNDEKQAAETELLGKNQLLDAVLNNIKDATLLTNHRCEIEQANSATSELFEIEADELIGMNLDGLIKGKRGIVYYDRIMNFLRSGDARLLDERIELGGIVRGNNAIDVPMELTISEVKLGSRKLFVNSLHDISARKAQQRELATANRRLKEISETDELTKLANRRVFEYVLKSSFRSARRLNLTMAMAIIDVDYFKHFNDLYGHPAGDECLIRIAKLFKKSFQREVESCARIGGEEFAIIMVGNDIERVKGILEELRTNVIGLGIPHARGVLDCVTVSIGAAMLTQDMKVPIDLYKSSDARLYKAKQAGRNQISICDAG